MHYQSVFRDDLFAGQVIVVTGGGSGIGRCIAHELASLGAGVVITGRQEAKLADVAVEISADGGAVDTLAFDIRDEEAVKANVNEFFAPWPHPRPSQQCGWPVPARRGHQR